MRCSLCAAVAAALCMLLAPPANARPAGEIAGVMVHPWRMQETGAVERTFAAVASTGVRWVRVDLRWLAVEPSGPSLSSGRADWSEMDAMVAAARRHGLELLPVVAYVPHWASDERDWWAYPNSVPFEDFFAAALRRYPHIAAWELWNEPNFGVFAKPHPDPAGFVDFLRSARRVHDRVGSRAKLISGGLAPSQPIDIVPWVDEVARLGGLELIDGLGVHPYAAAEPDDPRSWMMRLEALQRRLAFFGHPDLPLWITEYGAPSASLPSFYAPPLTEEQQAERLRVAFALATRLPFVENLTWYEYRDNCGDPQVADCHMGLVREDQSPKPAYEAMRAVAAGATTPLRTRLVIRTRVLREPRRRLVEVSGKLVLPGSPRPRTRVTLRVVRRAAATLRIRVPVRAGAFRVRLDREGRRRWRIAARYAGSSGYRPVVARAEVRPQ